MFYRISSRIFVELRYFFNWISRYRKKRYRWVFGWTSHFFILLWVSKITNFEPSISWLVITHPDGRDSSAVDSILTNSGDRHFLDSLQLFGILEEPHCLEQRRVQSHLYRLHWVHLAHGTTVHLVSLIFPRTMEKLMAHCLALNVVFCTDLPTIPIIWKLFNSKQFQYK